MDQRRYLADDEVRRLRTVTEAHAIQDQARGRITGPRRWIVVDLALSTGLRVSELAALVWGDWQPRRRLFSVRRLKRRQSGCESFKVTERLAAHVEDWRALCRSCVDSDPLVPGRFGGAMDRTTWRRLWQRACRAADVPVLPIHGARHTLAHQSLAETGDLARVQRMLGHASPTTTANMYGHVSEDAVAEMIETVERRWSGDG